MGMPASSFRGDPYRVLGLDRDATPAAIKARWRDLAREHHPDRATGDPAEQERLTARMARINAAYDILRDPVRRALHDVSPAARRARERDRGAWADAEDGPSGPPPPPASRPVTARFDTSSAFRARNATTGSGPTPLRGQEPRMRGVHDAENDLRASDPTGPVRRRQGRSWHHLPTLEESRDTVLQFGRFHGWTLRDVAEREPTYIDWIARTITRDRDLVIRARIVAADLDERGVERAVREPQPGFGRPRTEREAAEASA
jgi:curved DNA-binding protein CbpA